MESGQLPSAPTGLLALLRAVQPFATPMTLGRRLLAQDLMAGRVPPSERARMVQSSLDDGSSQADELATRLNSRDPAFLAQALGVAIIPIQTDSRYGDTLCFADYTAKPPTIHLYEQAIARIDRHLRQQAVAEVLGLNSCAPAFVAHELYHHLDNLRTQPIGRQHRVTLLQLGPWRLTSGVSILAEIAAGSFAQRLLALPIHAGIFDLVAQFDESYELAMVSAKSLAACAGPHPALTIEMPLDIGQVPG
jgi:hypothetical protein